MIPQAIAIGAISTLAALVGGFVYGMQLGKDIERGAQLRVAEVRAQTQQDAAEGVAREIAKLEPKLVTLKERVTREVREVPVYRECVHTPDGLRDINAALTAQPGNPFGDRGVPVPDAAGGPELRGDQPEAR